MKRAETKWNQLEWNRINYNEIGWLKITCKELYCDAMKEFKLKKWMKNERIEEIKWCNKSEEFEISPSGKLL